MVPNHRALDEHGQESSWETALTIYASPSQDEWGPVENECNALTQMVSSFRLTRVTRDARRQDDMTKALQGENVKARGEKESLARELAEANAAIKADRVEREHFQQRIEKAHEGYRCIYKEKIRLTEERDTACPMANEKAAATKSDNNNEELDGTIATRECQVCQAKLVLDKHRDFQLQTGHSADEWFQRATPLTPTHPELCDRHIHCKVNIGELVSQLTQTADVVTEVTKALKQFQTEAWTYKHLHEEAGRTLEASQKMHKDANELVEMLQNDISTKETISQVKERCAERLLADAMRENAAKDERISRLCDTLSTHPQGENKTHTLLDAAMVRIKSLEEQRITAERVREDVFELLNVEKAKSDGLLLTNRVLEDKLGQVQMELDISRDEKTDLEGELMNAHGDLETAGENARLWQMVVEQRIDQLLPEEQAETKGYVLRELRKQLEQALQEVQYYKNKNRVVRENAADLEYELQLHQQRLTDDAGQELFFYRTHWEKVEKIFDEKNELKAKLEAFEQRFTAELETEPLQLTHDPHAHKSFEEALGPEHVAQTLAMMKGQWGSHNPEEPCQTERVQGTYGMGPAGLPEGRPSVEMPEGYLERKAVREGKEEGGDSREECEECERIK